MHIGGESGISMEFDMELVTVKHSLIYFYQSDSPSTTTLCNILLGSIDGSPVHCTPSSLSGQEDFTLLRCSRKSLLCDGGLYCFVVLESNV